MTLPPFELHRAGTVEEATAFLDRYGDDAALYCGGTELLLLLKLGFASFGHLVDLKGISELRGVRAEDAALVIGAAVTHRELERDPLVRERLRALASMERRIANIRVRNAGTLGGNLCFSDPHSDPATFLLALDAEVECRRGGGEARRLPVGEFAAGPYQTALQPGELLTAVRVPLPPRGASVVHEKFAVHERPTATVTCVARAGGGRIEQASIAVGSVGPVPVRARAAEEVLAGAPVDDPEPVERAAEVAAELANPVDDAHGSADYKAHLVRVLVRRSFRAALGP